MTGHQKQLYLYRSKAQCVLQGMMGLGLTCFQSGVHLHSESSFNLDLAPLHHLSCNPIALQCDVGQAVWASTWFSFTFLSALILASSSSLIITRSLFQQEQRPADSKRHQHFTQTAAHQDWVMLKVSWALDFCYSAKTKWSSKHYSHSATLQHYVNAWQRQYIYYCRIYTYFSWAEDLSADNTFILKMFFAQAFFYIYNNFIFWQLLQLHRLVLQIYTFVLYEIVRFNRNWINIPGCISFDCEEWMWLGL